MKETEETIKQEILIHQSNKKDYNYDNNKLW